MGSKPRNGLLSHLSVFILLFAALLVAYPACATAKTSSPKILIINSYHEGYDWSDDEVKGLRSTISKSFPNTTYFTEFLDTKNFPRHEHFQHIADLLETKYAGAVFDAIVVMDNAALDFMTQYRNRLFRNAPVVFCGINNFTPGMISGEKDITGVAELQDSIGTLKMALELHPQTREVLVVHDYTVTGLAIRQELESALAQTSDMPNSIRISFMKDMRLDQTVESLQKLPSNALILILSYAVDKGGKSFSQSESARIISSASPVPVYAVHAAQLDHGVLGGKMLSGNSQGKKAGELTVQIIKGTPAGAIPVYTGYLSVNMFDYAALKKFRISPARLPKDSIIINKPSPNYAINKTAFWLIIMFASTTSIIVIAFYRNIRQRRKFEKHLQLSEAKFRQLFNSAGDAIFILDQQGNILEVNQAACDRLGYSRTDFLSLPFSRLVSPEQSDSISRHAEKVRLHKKLLFESTHITRNGMAIPVEISSTVIDFEGEPAFLNIARDISERKKAEGEIHLQTRLLEQEIAEHNQTEQLLRTERNNLNAIFESAPVGMALLNINSQLVSLNRIMSGLFQIKLTDLNGQRLGDLLRCINIDKQTGSCGDFSACQVCPLNTAIQKALIHGASLHGEELLFEFLQARHRQQCWIRFSVEPLLLEGKKHAVIAFEDISEKRLMAEKFRENEERLRLIFETSQSGITMISPDSRIEFANRRMAEMLGYTVEELTGISYAELLYPPECETGLGLLKTLINGDIQQSQTERSYVRKDGSVFGGYITARRLVDKNGKIKAIVASITDIDDIKVATDNLRAEKERLAVTLRSIGDGVITTDTEGNVVLLNQVAEMLTGWSQQMAAGNSIESVFRIISESSRQTQPNPVSIALSTGAVTELGSNTLLIARDGTERAIADSAAPITAENGKTIGAVLVFRDISEKKHVEEELFRARKLESIGVLAGGIAHDFNNYLTAILGNISLAKRLASPAEQIYEILENAETASNRAKGLTQQLLTFSKGGTPVRRLNSIGRIIEECASFVLRGSNVRPQLEIDMNLYPAKVDSGQISQVFNNLIINADQAMPDGGEVRITAANLPPASESDIPRIRITIADNGCGIPQANLERIFDPYFTTKKLGNGLGLTTVYSIIRNHQGEITVSSREGQGTTFTILLPAVCDNATETEEKTNNAPHRGSGKILIMDDEEIICEVLTNILNHFGYAVESCHDGLTACESFESARNNGAPFDAVILDITIPGGVGGKDTINMLKKIDPEVFGIVSSGYANDPIMARYRDYGFSAVLSKPYNVSEIEQLMKSIFPARK